MHWKVKTVYYEIIGEINFKSLKIVGRKKWKELLKEFIFTKWEGLL